MRCALAIVGCLTLLATVGCAMCANPYDRSYAAYGGRIQRVDRVHGRVGSILDPCANPLGAAPGTSMLVPTPADEQVFEESLPTEEQPWETGQAENDWPSDQQRVETVSWQPGYEEFSEAWPEEKLPGPDDGNDGTLPPLSELDHDAVDF